MWGKTWLVFAVYCTLVAGIDIQVRNESGYVAVSISNSEALEAEPPFHLSAVATSQEINVVNKRYMSDEIQERDNLKNYVKLNNMPYYSSATYTISINDDFVGYGYTPPNRPILVEPIRGKCASNNCTFSFQNIINKLKNRTELYIVGVKKSSRGFNLEEYVRNNVSHPDFFKYMVNIKNKENIVTIEYLPNHCSYNLWFVPVNTYNEVQMFGNSTQVNVTRDCSRNNEEEVSSAITTVIVALVIILLILGTVTASYYLIKVRRKRVPRRNNTQSVPLLTTVAQSTRSLLRKSRRTTTSRFGLQAFSEFLEQLPNGSNLLIDEFKSIGTDPSEDLYGKEFATKNRYANILPYGSNRVHLDLFSEPQADYINASFIKGYNGNNKYIATQGPLKATINDFWRMVWQEKVDLIVMLTNLVEVDKKKCDQYWPDFGEKKFGDVTVSFQDIKTGIDYNIRTFIIYNNNLSRKVTQMHYVTWPDKGIPLTPHSAVKFLRVARTISRDSIGPMIVHCSAGVGRTGAFILSDYEIDMAESESAVDFPQVLNHLRKSRIYMVQQEAQYTFSCCLVNEYLTASSSEIPVSDFTSIPNLSEQANFIKRSDYWTNVIFIKSVHHGWTRNRHKHRTSVPPSSAVGFISIPRYPKFDPESYYSDAVQMMNTTGSQTLIGTSQPTSKTLDSFWRLVENQECTLVLSLHAVNSNDKFWPTSQEIELKPVDYLSLTLEEIVVDRGFDIIRVKMNNTNTNTVQNIKVLQLNSWLYDSFPPTEDFIAYFKEFLQIYKSTETKNASKIIVCCYDAVSGCCPFMTFLRAIEHVCADDVVDVCSAARAVQIYRNNFYPTQEQLKFVYEAISCFVQQPFDVDFNGGEILYENLRHFIKESSL